jgi:ceramide glucosyltransferase
MEPHMDLFGALAGCVAAALTAAHIASSVVAAIRQRKNRLHLSIADVPRVTLIRPLKGVEPFSYVTLKSTFDLQPAAAEILFCVESATDPIIAIAERLIAEHPAASARVLIGREPISLNPKLNNLSKGWDAATYDWIAFVDSNVLLPIDALTRLADKVGRNTGMVSSPPVGSLPQTFEAKLECAFLNSYQARWQSAGDACGNGFAQGKVMYFHRAVIDAGGGIAALGSEPAEDAAAIKLVRRQGLRVKLVDRFFEQPIADRKFSDVWARQVRWAKLRRATFPVHFAAEILTGALLPITLGAVASHSAGLPVLPLAIVHFCLWYNIEMVLARWLGWPSTTIYSMARDVLVPVLWVQAWLSRDFSWQGHAMRAERPRDALSAG